MRQSAIDVEYLHRHPLRWVRLFWFHWTFAAAMWGIAASITYPVFSITTGYTLWPILLGGVGAVAAVSSFAPFDLRIQAFTAATIFGAAVFRVLMYVEVLWLGQIASEVKPIAWSLLLHWVVVACIGIAWPRISEHAGTPWTVEAGRADGGP